MRQAAKRATATPASDTPAPTPSLEQLTARWAQAANAKETAEKEAERLKAEILGRLEVLGFKDGFDAEGKGFMDANLEVGHTSKLDEKRLDEALEKKGFLERVQETKTSTKKVRALAELETEVAKIVDRCTEKSPRFLRVAKKA